MTPTKNATKSICIFLASVILFASCASTTLIQSTPTGADVYIDNQKKGTTPYNYSDTKIVGSSTPVTLKKENYQDLNVTLVRSEKADVGAIIGGILVLVPFLWTMKYDPIHNYELQPSSNQNQSNQSTSDNNNSTNELIKLKNLLDQKAITNDDYTSLKVKILNNQYEYTNSISDQITKLKQLLDSNLLTKDEYTSQVSKLINGK